MKFFSIIVISFLFFQSCVKKRDLSVNTLIVAVGTTPRGLHPFNDNEGPKTFVYSLTNKTLHQTDVRTLEQTPILIKALPDTFRDLRTFEVELRDGITWDDGSPLLAKDVVFSAKITVAPLTNNPRIKSIYSSALEKVWVDADNPRKLYYRTKTIRITSKTIFQEIYIQQKDKWDPQDVLSELTFENLTTHKPSEKLKKWFEDFNHGDNRFMPERLTGLGRYQVAEYVPKSHVTLVKKKNHWAEGDTSIYNTAYPDKVIFKDIDKDAVKLAIKSEQIDVYRRVGPRTLGKLQRRDYFNENYYSAFENKFMYMYLGMNMKPDLTYQKPFFVDKKVRKAMAHLVPVDEILEVLYDAKGVRQISNVSSFSKRFNDTLKPVPFDIEKAKILLDEAGWVDTDGDNVRDKVINGEKVPFAFKGAYMSRGSSKSVALMIAGEMRKAGIKFIPNPMDFSVFYDRAFKHDFDMMMGVWGSGSTYSDPGQLWGTNNWANKGANFCGFGNAYSDSLIRACNETVNDSIHKDSYNKFQALLHEEQPYVFLLSVQEGVVIHNRFANAQSFIESPIVLLNNLKLKEDYKPKKKK